MNGQDKVLSVFAFLALDHDGTEGVCSAEIPGLGHMPLIGADLARVEALRPWAQRVATESGVPVTLAHFSVRTDSETLHPR